MSHRRFDRAGELTARDQILRVRTYHHADGRQFTAEPPTGFVLRFDSRTGQSALLAWDQTAGAEPSLS
jgi:hypothetical protein